MLREAMESGAMGMTTGLIYPPGGFSKQAELTELCKVVAEYNGVYATHMREEGDLVVESVREAIETTRDAGCRDDTKVGKRRNGKYIVLQGKKHGSYTDAVCMELYQLDDMNMRMGNSRQGAAQQHCYVVDSKYADLTDNDPADDGTIISTRDLLIDKMWYEVDLKTGKRKRTEVRYEKDGMALFCTMAENYKSELPDWQMREFYFSDNIEREFKHSKIGDRVNGIYLVVKERGADGKWFAANYDISTLSANRLVLDCVYPQGMPTRVFMTRSGIETSHRNIQKHNNGN
ncbi:MAG: hypothetical protein II260_08105 [Muribaculaceae bacterium]|nr:hypothetical protein [Muribaculaceae bacterium]